MSPGTTNDSGRLITAKATTIHVSSTRKSVPIRSGTGVESGIRRLAWTFGRLHSGTRPGGGVRRHVDHRRDPEEEHHARDERADDDLALASDPVDDVLIARCGHRGACSLSGGDRERSLFTETGGRLTSYLWCLQITNANRTTRWTRAQIVGIRVNHDCRIGSDGFVSRLREIVATARAMVRLAGNALQLPPSSPVAIIVRAQGSGEGRLARGTRECMERVEFATYTF